MPRGQVLTPRSHRAYDSTQLTVINQRLKLDEKWVKAELATEHRHQTPFVNGRSQTINILHIVPERLFDVEITAGFGGRERNLQM